MKKIKKKDNTSPVWALIPDVEYAWYQRFMFWIYINRPSLGIERYYRTPKHMIGVRYFHFVNRLDISNRWNEIRFLNKMHIKACYFIEGLGFIVRLVFGKI